MTLTDAALAELHAKSNKTGYGPIVAHITLRAVTAELIAARAEIARLREAATTDPCLLKREPDEPMFVLLARDAAAPATMKEWCRLRSNEIRSGFRPNTKQERQHIAEVAAKAEAFREWRRTHR